MAHSGFQLSSEQRGVAIGMASALLTAVLVFIFAGYFGGERISPDVPISFRLELLGASLMALAAPLFVCIARLAKHRFFTPADIEGSALTEGSARAKLLQALLQNTLEQAALALTVYIASAFILPSPLIGLVLAAGASFLLGRLLFCSAYARGAAARAFGFAFTFYPTVLLGGITTYFLLVAFMA